MSEPKSKRRKVNSSRHDNPQTALIGGLEKDFGVKFGRDIGPIWGWAVKEHPKDPLRSLSKLLKAELCGPFRHLNTGKENKPDQKGLAGELHMLDRVWQCPPEMQPCLRTPAALYGFWRDIPSEEPIFIVKKVPDCGALVPVATDLVDLIRVLGKKVKLPASLLKITESLNSSETLKQRESKRKKSVVARTFNKVGIAVPVGDNEIGYRPLTLSYSELDDVLTRSCETDDDGKKDKILAPFDECMNYIQFANDECDYGMGFEMGMCVFSHSTSRNFMGTIESLLPLAYTLLGRPLYADIMKRICEERGGEDEERGGEDEARRVKAE